MSNRSYPHYVGREKYHGMTKKCDCCAEPARFIVEFQTSWSRSDDVGYLTCEQHAFLARTDYPAFCALVAKRNEHMRQIIEAQHEETGRRWLGERRALPPRYQELPVSEPRE